MVDQGAPPRTRYLVRSPSPFEQTTGAITPRLLPGQLVPASPAVTLACFLGDIEEVIPHEQPG